MDKLDKDRAAREEALNTLEAYIYRSRDFLEDELFGKVSSDAERKSLKEKIEAASEWLFSSDSATYEDFKSKLAELTYFLLKDVADRRSIEGPIAKRKADYLARPQRIESLQLILNSTKELVKSSRDLIVSQLPKSKNEDDLEDEETDSASATASPTAALFAFDENSISTLESVVTEVETWLTKKLAAQEKLKLWEEPVLLLSDLEKKGNQIQSALRKLLQEQQKKTSSSAKKSASKTTSSSPSSTTVLAETTTASVAAEETDGPVYTEVVDDDEVQETYTTTETVTAIIEESEAEETETAGSGGVKHEEL